MSNKNKSASAAAGLAAAPASKPALASSTPPGGDHDCPVCGNPLKTPVSLGCACDQPVCFRCAVTRNADPALSFMECGVCKQRATTVRVRYDVVEAITTARIEHPLRGDEAEVAEVTSRGSHLLPSAAATTAAAAVVVPRAGYFLAVSLIDGDVDRPDYDDVQNDMLLTLEPREPRTGLTPFKCEQVYGNPYTGRGYLDDGGNGFYLFSDADGSPESITTVRVAPTTGDWYGRVWLDEGGWSFFASWKAQEPPASCPPFPALLDYSGGAVVD